MSFPQYLNYKPSPIECAPSVPAHWAISKLKRVMEFRTGWTPPTGRDDYYRGPNPWVTIGDMRSKYLEVTEKQISDEAARVARMSPVPKGSLLFSFKLSIGQVSFAGCELYTNEAIASFSPDGSLNLGYCYYAFPIFVSANAAENIYGAKLLNQQLIGDATILIPSISEQQEIARFLDNETGKIDELIAEQERLIELLKEKRQAVISQAVTKGLNPDAPMKPSGVEWIGDIPGHWRMIPLKRNIEFVTSGSRGWAGNYSDDGDVFIRIGNLTRDSIRLDLSDIQRVFVEDGAEGSRTRVRSGDVLFSITAYLGSVAVISDLNENAYVSQHVALTRLKQEHLVPKWVGFVALSVIGKTWFEMQSYGGTKIQLSLDDISNFPVPVPSVLEQRVIVDWIERELARYDALTIEANGAISLLKERRSALIAAAVTGQIDVRGFAEQSAA